MNLHNLTTLRDLSKRSGISYHTLRYRLITRGIKTIKVGDLLLINKKDANKITAKKAS